MSLLFGGQSQRALGDTSTQLVPPRSKAIGSVVVSQDTAMRHSAVWACLRLRADLVSTMPVSSTRQMQGVDIAVEPTRFLTDPGGDGYGIADWLYSSQMDLDRVGNVFGIIRGTDQYGLPAVVELVPFEQVTIRGNGPRITGYRIHGEAYTPDQVWHERQFTVPGVPLGLSPIAYAAQSIGGYLSAQQFALDWFMNGTIPSGRLKNVNKRISPKEARIAKDRFKAAVASRDLFVHGADWEYDMLQVAASESQFLEAMQYGVNDVTRFLGVPADLIDATAAHTNSRVVYANITQRHLQFLILNLGPSIARREARLSQALPKPRKARLDTDYLLRLDPISLSSMLAEQVTNRLRAPSEAREQLGLLPFTPAQIAEFAIVPGPTSSSNTTVISEGGS